MYSTSKNTAKQTYTYVHQHSNKPKTHIQTLLVHYSSIALSKVHIYYTVGSGTKQWRNLRGLTSCKRISTSTCCYIHLLCCLYSISSLEVNIFDTTWCCFSVVCSYTWSDFSEQCPVRSWITFPGQFLPNRAVVPVHMEAVVCLASNFNRCTHMEDSLFLRIAH